MRSILILDDESYVRQSFFDYFEDQEWRPVMAESAEEALILIDKHCPDAAIVDIRLPGMNGNDFIREVSRHHKAIVFVICSGSPEYQVPDDLIILPCVYEQVFKKPVTDLKALEDKISETIKLLKSV